MRKQIWFAWQPLANRDTRSSQLRRVLRNKLALQHCEEVLVPGIDGAGHAPVQAILWGRLPVASTLHHLVRIPVAVWPWMPVCSVGEGPCDVHYSYARRVLADAPCLFYGFDLVGVERVCVGISRELWFLQWFRLACARASRVPFPSFVVLRRVGSQNR